MSDIITLKLTIDGDLHGNSMCHSMVNWVVHRANLLNLAGNINFQNTTSIELTISGERVLVEAFEVACSLGPADTLVESITRCEVATPDSFYRQPREFIRYSNQYPEPSTDYT